jgi:hypothetical protein
VGCIRLCARTKRVAGLTLRAVKAFALNHGLSIRAPAGLRSWAHADQSSAIRDLTTLVSGSNTLERLYLLAEAFTLDKGDHHVQQLLALNDIGPISPQCRPRVHIRAPTRRRASLDMQLRHARAPLDCIPALYDGAREASSDIFNTQANTSPRPGSAGQAATCVLGTRKTTNIYTR